jgi:hypothetical protein
MPRQRRKDFSSNLCVQTGSGAHPASSPTGTGGKARPWCDADHSPHLVQRSWMSRSYTSSPQAPSWRVAGLLYFLTSRIRNWNASHSTTTFGLKHCWRSLKRLLKLLPSWVTFGRRIIVWKQRDFGIWQWIMRFNSVDSETGAHTQNTVLWSERK